LKAVVKDLKLGQKELEYEHSVNKQMVEMIGEEISVSRLSTGYYFGNGCLWHKSWLNFPKKKGRRQGR